MCGITGKIRFDGRPVGAEDIQHMNAAIAHRGPDDAGVYVSPDHAVGLGSQRLAVVDLTSRGHQPLRYRDRYVIVFNGEIYNFRELRTQLEREDEAFVSNTDTEVVVALYARHGTSCVTRLRGMFAFAVYDEWERTLFCARDRLGKKPFKYYHDHRVFLFGSELKAILTQPEYAREPDPEAISHYLTFQYCPAPSTGFRNIRKLAPAHWMLLDVPRGRLTSARYWTLDPSKKVQSSSEEWTTRLREKLADAVRVRLAADVPVGAFLSGGLDSSVVVALMSAASSTPVKTFSVGFSGDPASELTFARLVARRFHTDHTELVVRPDTVSLLPRLVRQFEEPFGDSSAVPTFLVSELARKSVTVALTGDGGDEQFAGYPRYTAQKVAEALQPFLLLNRWGVLPVSAWLAHVVPGTLTTRLHRFAETLDDDPARRHLGYVGYFSECEKHELFTDNFWSRFAPADSRDLLVRAFRDASATSPVEQALYADIGTYLADDLLPKMDLASMSVSLEARSPLLDHELFELTAGMPLNLKIRGWTRRKFLFREAVRDLLPEEILRRRKRGFSLPVDAWFRGELRAFASDTLLSTQCARRGILEPHSVRTLLDAHQSSRRPLGKALWILLMLELWFQEFF